MTIADPSQPLATGPTGRTPVPGATAARELAAASPWFGVLAVAGAAVWLGVVGFRSLVAAHDLRGALLNEWSATVGPALLLAVVALFLAERLWPAVRRPALARAHVVDAGYLALFAVAVVPLLVIVQTGFAVEIERHAQFLVLNRLPLVPQVAVVLVILVGVDAMNWVAHVANHRSPSLWRLHALHHSQEDMSVLTTFRTHPLVHATYLLALLPALVLGASGHLPMAALIAYGCLVTLPHANLSWTLGPVGRLVVSPAYHRLHHASELDPQGTVNFGFVLVCWDQLIGCAAMPGGRPPVRTGLAGRPVPVEQFGGGGPFGVVVAQLVQPFRRYTALEEGR